MTAWLPRPVYWLARKLLPIPCVDVLAYRDLGTGPQIGLIRRVGADGRTVGWSLIGGRIMKQESLADAITRHIRSTLGDAVEIGKVDTSAPIHAAEYSPGGRVNGRIDPRKHAIALSYVVEIAGPTTPTGEAIAFKWFPTGAVPAPESFAYSHDEVVAALIRADARLHHRECGDARDANGLR